MTFVKELSGFYHTRGVTRVRAEDERIGGEVCANNDRPDSQYQERAGNPGQGEDP